ncbi:hypothetical protein [Frisingicoccus sp.]|uniref:hypothetical protein n=1 Tax=Frisingicoccus sp. TaxID=1918627 RepID=UPI00386B6B45
MKDIDSAERKGDYGVATDMGESCITCLSTGCKLGLLALYYRTNPRVKLLIEIEAAGKNVWKWLASNENLQFYVLKEKVNYAFLGIPHIEVLDDGKIYNPDDSHKFWELIHRCENSPYIVTKKTENRAYQHYMGYREKHVHCPVKEELEITEFIKRFSGSEYYLDTEHFNDTFSEDEYTDLFEDFRVINYCSYLPDHFPFRRHPIYICGNRQNKIEFEKTNSVTYPGFLELLFSDVLNGEYSVMEETGQVFHPYRKEYDAWFALILEGDESCPVQTYPKDTMFGIEVEMEKKCITIYDNEQAIDRFHSLYSKIVE